VVDVKNEGAIVGGCCVFAIVGYVVMIAATVWAILDLLNGAHHQVVDIVILVVMGLSVLGGGAKSRS
jgi:hypothetical protein